MFIFIKYIVWFLEFGLFIPSINISTRFFTYSSYNKFISDYEYYSCRLILAITIILVWEINNYLTQLSSPRCTLVDSVVKDLKDMVLVYRKEIKIN